MAEKSRVPSVLIGHTPWEPESNPIWLATCFTLYRNLAKFNFPPKMQGGQFEQTLGLVKEQLFQSPLIKQPTLLDANSLNNLDKEFLYEHFLCSRGIQNTSSGQGFITDESGHFFAELNMQNHLQMQLTDCQGKWEEAWNALNQIETALGAKLGFAFSAKFGFLTAEPSLCGTGLIVQAYLHLPALIHTKQLQETLLKQKEEGIHVTSMGGNLEEIVGDLIIVENNYTLGITEESIIRSVHSMVMKLMAIENKLRSHLQTTGNTEIKDQVCRAFGLLKHSYQLQTKEALEALSLIKLGLNLNWVQGITNSELNALFFRCRRGHLLHALGETELTDLQEIAHRRAEYLHKHMAHVTLKEEG